MKLLCLERHQAAANAALKLPPLCRELVKATASSVKKEVRDYSRAISLAKYDGDPSDPLSLKHIKSEDFLEEASEQIPIMHTIVTALHKVGTK